MRTQNLYMYLIMSLGTLMLISFSFEAFAQGDLQDQVRGYSISVNQPECFGEFGQVTIMSSATDVSYAAALDNDDFSTVSSFQDVTVGVHSVRIVDKSGEHTIDFRMMPEEDIGFDFVDVFPANCLGENGRIVGAITGSGSSGAEYIGSGILVFESTEIGPTIDVNVDAGEYTLSAVLDDNIRRDTILIVPSRSCDVYIPNVIIGSTLSGNNDQFQLFFDEGLTPFVLDYLIYDRWGNLVYEQNNFEAVGFDDWWEGDCLGSPCAVGTYVYLVIIDMGDDVILERKGTVNFLEYAPIKTYMVLLF